MYYVASVASTTSLPSLQRTHKTRMYDWARLGRVLLIEGELPFMCMVQVGRSQLWGEYIMG